MEEANSFPYEHARTRFVSRYVYMHIHTHTPTGHTIISGDDLRRGAVPARVGGCAGGCCPAGVGRLASRSEIRSSVMCCRCVCTSFARLPRAVLLVAREATTDRTPQPYFARCLVCMFVIWFCMYICYVCVRASCSCGAALPLQSRTRPDMNASTMTVVYLCYVCLVSYSRTLAYLSERLDGATPRIYVSVYACLYLCVCCLSHTRPAPGASGPGQEPPIEIAALSQAPAAKCICCVMSDCSRLCYACSSYPSICLWRARRRSPADLIYDDGDLPRHPGPAPKRVLADSLGI